MSINMPCLKYLAYLPKLEDRLYVFVNNMSKQGYPIEYIKSVGMGEYSDVLKASDEDFAYKKVAYSCRNVAKEYLSAAGFKDKLCMACFYYNKCQNFRKDAEYKAIKYLIDYYPNNDYELSVDCFTSQEVYFYKDNNALSYSIIELPRAAFRLIGEARFKEVESKDKLIRFLEDSLTDIVRKDSPDSACKYIKGLFRDSILSMEDAAVEDLESLKEPINTKVLATEYRKEAVNKALIAAPITEDDLFQVPIQMQQKSSRTGEKQAERPDVTYSGGMKKGAEVFDLKGLLRLYEDETDNESIPTALPIADSDNVSEPAPNNSDEDGVENKTDVTTESSNDDGSPSEAAELPDEDNMSTASADNATVDEIEDFNFNALFNQNGELLLIKDKANEDYIVTDRTNILNLLGILKTDNIVSIEAAVLGDIRGILVKSKSLALPFFINEAYINEYVVSELFTSKRCILVSSNACMLTRYLIRYNKLNGAEIRSLAAVYNALSETRIITPVNECLTYIDYKKDSLWNNTYAFLTGYKIAFDSIKLELLRKEKGKSYSINLDYEMALGSTQNMRDYFNTDDNNILRNDFINATFAYNGMYKKRDKGVVFTYAFYDDITHAPANMELTKRVVVSIFKDDFLRQFRLILLSIEGGKITLFSPFVGKKNEALINEKVLQIIQRWHQKMQLNTPHIDVENY